MTELLVTLGVLALVVLLAVVLGVWLLVRAVRRSRALAVAREVGSYGAMVVTLCRTRSAPDRDSAALALRVSRAHARLRRQLALAERSGAHLGDVPALLPRLQAEGNRIATALRQLAVVPTPAGGRLREEARVHLAAVADLESAVQESVLATATDELLARDVEDAAVALRCRAAAHAELRAS